MKRAESQDGRYLPRALLAIVPGVAASAFAVFVLTSVNLTQGTDSTDRVVNSAVSDDNLTAEERRELTRQMLRARRENPEIPAAVIPTARSAPAKSTDALAPAQGATTAVATPPIPRPARPRPEARTQPAPSGVAAAQAAPGTGTPPPAGPPAANPAVRLPPVEVNTVAPDQDEPAPRSLAATMFSSISGFAGTAANATGNSINWVIALPGRAISAGGKLVGGQSADPAALPPAPPTASPPAPAPNDTSPPKAKQL